MRDMLRGLAGSRGSVRSDEIVTVVSGLPRSGTSMMMKMLEAGGMRCLTDGLRKADADNPKGYYELERVKGLRKGDTAWVGDARGKAVKVISELLRYLPGEHTYQIVFVLRDIDEVLASQRKMLANRGERVSTPKEDAKLSALFRRHLGEVRAWLAERQNMHVLYLDHRRILSDPAAVAPRINEFLGGGLDVVRMAEAVDPSLYRQRAGEG